MIASLVAHAPAADTSLPATEEHPWAQPPSPPLYITSLYAAFDDMDNDTSSASPALVVGNITAEVIVEADMPEGVATDSGVSGTLVVIIIFL
ncbi:hypothetical protein GUJ93_ZPchr0012g21734 [Zizania palustris]|uniref:Uncharacterized protein n=1 Tax=Zizania palustris TaxID=103762 RepID=A0A8J5WXC4_ZIZPA|nr:hypothetical protein GUJ93_ZPchr0012g21734 [Zizania palustris]